MADLVIEHSRKTSTSTIDLSEIRRSVLFTNSKIERQASIELVEAVFSQLVQKGNAIWKDKSKSKCLLSSQTFSSLAAALYNWAQMSGHINQVCTIFELSQGEEISKKIFRERISLKSVFRWRNLPKCARRNHHNRAQALAKRAKS